MSLALKFKLALREHWDAPTCPALKALQGLGDTLGVIVKCQPEWPIIVSELRPAYDERGVDLVASVAGLVRGVCEAVEELVDGGGGDETWGDTLLEKLGESFRTLKIFPEVSSGSLDRPQAKWDDERGGIILDLPKSAIATPLEFIPIFKEELRTAFDKKPTSSQVLDEEDAVIIDSTTTPLKDLSINTQSRSVVQYLPDASLIPRPDELLQRPPYILHVRASGDHRVDIECTHSPSLQVLATYLKRWCRTNHNLSTKPPVVDVRLEQGSFGAGLLHDVLTIGADQGRFHVSPTLVLHLVESVLGYERVHTDICSWQFRRDTPFKAV